MSGVEVRLATPEDAPGIARVHVASWRAAYRGIVPDPILDALSVERRTMYWHDTTTNPGEVPTWVAVVGAELVGFASGGPHRDDDLPPGAGELWSIYVQPASWGVGVGRALFERAVADLGARGFGPLALWVLTANERGRRFYERHGWRGDGATRVLDFDGTPIEEMRYRGPVRTPEAADRTIG